MDFGDCLTMLKQGKKMARRGWNGKGMFIYLVQGRQVAECDWKGAPECLTYIHWPGKAEKQKAAVFNSHIDMKTADGTICVGWLASQTDMLADDWEVVL